MRKRLFLTIVLAVTLAVNSCAQAAAESRALSDIVNLKNNCYSCSFEGVKHDFILYLPEKAEGAPLVVLLPGYGNTAESFQNSTHFEQTANKEGYAVVYVTGAPNPNDPVSAVGWNSGIGTEGNDDVAFLASLAEALQEQYALDKTRIFAVGFSNGAFMTHRLAMEAGNTFSAFVSVAGLMPEKVWDDRKGKNDISFFQITGEKDDVVPKNSDGSAEYAPAPAIEDVMTYWAMSNGLEKCESEEIGKGSILTKYRSDEKKNQVWTLFIKNGRHSWPNEKRCGIDANSLILAFFETVSD